MGCQPDESGSPSPDEVFIKYYGGSAIDEAADFIALGSSGDSRAYVILGASNSEELIGAERAEGFTDYVLIFADKEGYAMDDVRSFSPDVTAASVECMPRRIKPTSDGGYIIAGSAMYDGQSDVFIVKVDGEGNLVSSWLSATAGNEVANDIIEVSDGFVVAGSVGTGNGIQALIVKLSSDLSTVIWSTSRGADNEIDAGISLVSVDNGTRAVMVVNTNQPIVVGGSPNGNLQIYEFDTDVEVAPNPNGQPLGQEDFNEIAVRIKAISDNEFYIMGNTSPVNTTSVRPFFKRIITSTTGVTEVASNRFDNFTGVSGNDIYRTLNGNFLMVGTGVSNVTNGQQIFLMRLDAFGAVDDSFGDAAAVGFPAHQFGSLGDETGVAVAQLPDGGIGLLGTISLDNNANTVIGLIKTNRNGVLGK